jgi:hypothetical protein
LIVASGVALVWAIPAGAELILNEALANEPGSVTTTEWVEILNWPDTGTSLSIKGYRYLDGGDTTRIDTNLSIPAGEFLILARKVTGTSSFESAWGNNSGVWGDSPSENYPVIGITKMSLRNSCDTITLIAPSGSKSVIWWRSDPGDGVSVERIRPGPNDDWSNFHGCVATTGSTPGHANSVLPGRYDLLLDTVICSPPTPSWGDTITFVSTVQNCGTGAVPFADFAYRRDHAPLAADTNFVELMTQPLGFVDELGEAMPRWNWADAAPGVSHIRCEIRGDSNAANNSAWVDLKVRFTTPLLIISEFLANPGPGGPDEWVEIANVAGFPINLEGMSIGDSLNSDDIPTPSREIAPGEFWVLAENEAGFRVYYPNFAGTLIGIKGWRGLNNSGDGIRLWGPSGEIVDSLTFRTTYEANRSLERVELTPSFARTRDWAGSTAADGATPGRPNSIQRGQPGTLIFDSISVDPPVPQWGQAVHVRAALHNVGFGPAEGWVLSILRDLDLSSPGSELMQIAELSVPILSEGEETGVDTEWIDAPPGISRIICVLRTPAGAPADSSAMVTTVAYTQPLLIISEYLVAPAPYGPGEWVELYNASSFSLSLAGLRLGDSTSFTTLPAGNGSLGPGAFVVLCQDADQFTSFHRNFTGDLLELTGWRTLGDEGDRMRLLGPAGEIIDSLTYTRTPSGNVSSERRQLVPEFADPRDWGDCIDPEGATPGRANSIRRVYRDLALDSVIFDSIEGTDMDDVSFHFWVSNRGFSTISDGKITWRLEPGFTSDDTWDIPSVAPGEMQDIPFMVEEPSPGWNRLAAHLAADDDDSNNADTATVLVPFGRPGLIISEFLANPAPDGPGEWVELYVTNYRAFSSLGFALGDSGSLSPWPATGLFERMLAPGEFVVLAQDEQAFRQFYQGFNGVAIEVPHWPALNNSGDLVRVVDASGGLQDSTGFQTIYADNHSVERTELAPPYEGPGGWTESVDPSGATPGRTNSVSAAVAGPLHIDLAPNPFYRSWGQSAQVGVRLQIGERLTLKIFDRDGHPVRTLVDNRPSATGSLEWDGTGEDGVPLRPGPYIVWARSEPSGIEQKAVIVLGP